MEESIIVDSRDRMRSFSVKVYPLTSSSTSTRRKKKRVSAGADIRSTAIRS